MTKSVNITDEFFKTIPDKVLINMALYDWNSLRNICMDLTLDLQMIEEYENKKKKKTSLGS